MTDLIKVRQLAVLLLPATLYSCAHPNPVWAESTQTGGLISEYPSR